MVTKLRTSEKVGSGSSGEQALKVDRSQVAKGLVDTVPVVEQQVYRDRAFSFLSGPEMQSVDAFDLERLEERLGAGIVVGRARAAHALDTAHSGHLASEVP